MRNLAVTAMFITALFLISCGGSEPVQKPPQPSVPSPPTSSVDANALYKDNCAVCHGTNRQGLPNLGPSLVPGSLARLSDAQIRDIISEGRPNTAMAGFKGRLSPEQIDALVRFYLLKTQVMLFEAVETGVHKQNF